MNYIIAYLVSWGVSILVLMASLYYWASLLAGSFIYLPDFAADFGTVYNPLSLASALALAGAGAFLAVRAGRSSTNRVQQQGRFSARPGRFYLAVLMSLAVSSIVLQLVTRQTESLGCGWFGCSSAQFVDPLYSGIALVLIGAGWLFVYPAAKVWVSIPTIPPPVAFEGTPSAPAPSRVGATLGVGVRNPVQLGKNLGLLGVVAILAGLVVMFSNFCLWSCSAAQEAFGSIGSIAFLIGIAMAVLGAIVYSSGRSEAPTGTPSRRPTAGALVSLVSGIAITVLGGLSSLGGLIWSTTSGGLGSLLGLSALVLGPVMIVGSVKLRKVPRRHKLWGATIVACSLLSLFTVIGGFILGLLGLIGGVLAIAWFPAIRPDGSD